MQLFQTSSETRWTVSRYLPLGEGLNERAGSAEARPGRTPRLSCPPPEPEDACSRGAEGSGKQQIPEALSGSVCVLRGIKSALVPLSTFLRFLLIPEGKKKQKTWAAQCERSRLDRVQNGSPASPDK